MIVLRKPFLTLLQCPLVYIQTNDIAKVQINLKMKKYTESQADAVALDGIGLTTKFETHSTRQTVKTILVLLVILLIGAGIAVAIYYGLSNQKGEFYYYRYIFFVIVIFL